MKLSDSILLFVAAFFGIGQPYAKEPDVNLAGNLPVLLKTHCATSAIYLIASHKGIKVSYDSINNWVCGEKNTKVSLLDLKDYFASVGLKCRGVKCTSSDLMALTVPSILVQKSVDGEPHYVVARYSSKTDQFQLFDPIYGNDAKLIKAADLDSICTGIALVFN